MFTPLGVECTTVTAMASRLTPALARTARPAVTFARDRLTLADGAQTTVYVAAYDLDVYAVQVAVLPQQEPLMGFCARHGHDEALVGGFFHRPEGLPLGEVRTGGELHPSVAFDAPWGGLRACVHVQDGQVALARRDALPAAPRGDLLQAGPLLVQAGRRVFDHHDDFEGFSAGAHQFDSDITAERHPRAALAIAGRRLLAVACDGRGPGDSGLGLGELADHLVALGAEAALNLDGGGSTTLVTGGRLANRPRAQFGVDEIGGRPISTALVFTPRA